MCELTGCIGACLNFHAELRGAGEIVHQQLLIAHNDHPVHIDDSMCDIWSRIINNQPVLAHSNCKHGGREGKLCGKGLHGTVPDEHLSQQSIVETYMATLLSAKVNE